MTSYCQYALKEWLVTIDSLRAGRQIILLRKGGIHEQRDGFRVEHSDFFLFPTFLHQSQQALHPAFRTQWEHQPGMKAPTIILNTYAKVQELIPILKLEALRGLDGLHTLDWATVEQRFFYRNRPGLNLLLLRVYQLTVPQSVENLDRYDGCVSWVELDRAVPLAGAEAVLGASTFDQQAELIRNLTAQHLLL